MSRKSVRKLTAEDRILWNQVARTVTPLPGMTVEPEETDIPKPDTRPEPLVKRAVPAAPAGKPVERRLGPPGAIDTKTRGRIAKGRVVIDARIDLHGLTQTEAHGLLLSFLHRARASGLRHVLVITGKGSAPMSEGVLRRAVPSWFATAPFRGLVSGHAPASRKHGGEGALYVRLRRAPGEAG